MQDSGNFIDERVTKEEMTLAVVAHALSFVEGGVIGPLIVYLVKRKDSPFVAFHALQSFLWGAITFVVMIVGTILFVGIMVVLAAETEAGVVIGLLAIPLVGLGSLSYFIYEIIACLRTSEKRWYKLPIVGDMALKTHPIPQFVEKPVEESVEKPVEPPVAEPAHEPVAK